MGGLEWEALPIAIEKFGIEDVDTLLNHLVAIRNDQDKRREQE